MKIEIIYQDSDHLALYKPAGVVVNRSQTTTEATLQDWAVDNLREVKSNLEKSQVDPVFKKRTGMVHRLDKQTSGIILWAKHPQAMFGLMKQFKARQVSKSYLTLVHGQLAVEQGQIRLPLGRLPQDKTKFGVVINGKMSQTEYQVRHLFAPTSDFQDGFSLVEVKPITGRTHQIRVVMNHLGHPVVGDSYYLHKKRAQLDADYTSRHLLHAWKIKYQQPHTGRDLELTAEPRSDFSQPITKITQQAYPNEIN